MYLHGIGVFIFNMFHPKPPIPSLSGFAFGIFPCAEAPSLQTLTACHVLLIEATEVTYVEKVVLLPLLDGNCL